MIIDEPLGLRAIIEVGLSYVENLFPTIDTYRYDQLGMAIDSFMRGTISADMAQHIFFRTIGRIDPFIHMMEIAGVRDEPIQPKEIDQQDSGEEGHNRKKTRSWSQYEDKRLLAGILRFGLDNWSQVADFVGNNRTRAQCSQRWSRGLNPKLCKKHWNSEEDAQLLNLVHTFGEKAWTKIASYFGNRSDVQCRYHYRQISKDGVAQPNPNYLGLAKNTCVSLSSGLIRNSKMALNPSPALITQSQMSLADRQPINLVGGVNVNPAALIMNAGAKGQNEIEKNFPPMVISNNYCLKQSAGQAPQTANGQKSLPSLDSFLVHFK